MRISLWYPLWEDLHCTRRRGTGAEGHAGMSRSVFAAPKTLGLLCMRQEDRACTVHLNHGLWRMEGREGGSASGSTGA